MLNLTKIIAEKMFCARLSVGLEVIELSGITGISPEVLTSIEDGKYRPTPDELLRLTGALKIKPSDLLS